MINLHGVLAPGEMAQPPRRPAPRRREVNMQCNSCKHIGLRDMCPDPIGGVFTGQVVCIRTEPHVAIRDVLEPPCGLDRWEPSFRWVLTLKRGGRAVP